MSCSSLFKKLGPPALATVLNFASRKHTLSYTKESYKGAKDSLYERLGSLSSATEKKLARSITRAEKGAQIGMLFGVAECALQGATLVGKKIGSTCSISILKGTPCYALSILSIGLAAVSAITSTAAINGARFRGRTHHG